MPKSPAQAKPAKANPSKRENSSAKRSDANSLGLEDYDFEESIGYWLTLASQAYQNALADELAPHGITFRQCQVLGWLVRFGELSQVDLAQRMMIEPATLVGVLDRMERDKLICRTSAPKDRRRKIIQLDVRAQEVWSTVILCARNVRTRAISKATPRQIATLKKLLKLVLAQFN